MKKERLDLLLVEYGLAESQEHAKRLIMAGLAVADDHRIDKPGQLISRDAVLRLKETLPYVSRGGLKLEKAVSAFGLDFKNKTVLDIGSSTGGFTDLALQKGAKKVFAVDVGTNQLHEKLRKDSRVISLEQTNFRTIPFETIGEKADIIVSDVSFISLSMIIPSCVQFCREGTEAVLLIKPQFEAERGEIGRNGIVSDTSVHVRVIESVIRAAEESSLFFRGLVQSPIRGAKGNLEYPAYFVYNCPSDFVGLTEIIKRVADENYIYYSKASRGESQTDS
ncbi:MAG: TlyA family RNA methyltransferase [Geovibrio sp.]|nr:TlyA family RNA methyltransferase [Geovibrio sp.]